MAGIYIHIPFCKQACHYCDFHFSVNQSNSKEVVQSINRELTLRQEYLNNEVVNTVYFGGGTPSILPPDQLASILETIHKHYNTDIKELTIEANPDDLHKENLRILRSLGFNRLSIGIQSFENDLLKFMNRPHTGEEAIDAVEAARQNDFNNISIDLIYAIPGLDEERWIKTIEKALTLSPEHISCYSLTIENKTAFGKWHERGKLKAVEDDISASQLETLIDMLNNQNYEHYEVSNFAKPGFQSQHNSSYWKQVSYLGVGPSAHSYNGNTRQFNVSNNHLYVKALDKDFIPAELETLTHAQRINEYLLTTLRTSWGCNLDYLTNTLGFNLLQNNQAYINQLLNQNLAEISNNSLVLTKKGRLLADKIASDLFLADTANL